MRLKGVGGDALGLILMSSPRRSSPGVKEIFLTLSIIPLLDYQAQVLDVKQIYETSGQA